MNGSESCYSEADLQEILNELERSIEDREQKQSQIKQLEQEVSELSLQNSELMSELRNKSEMIKSLNARIGILSESDKVLKQNAKLKQLNEQLKSEKQHTEQEAAAMVLSVKEEYSQKESELAQTQAAADQAKRDAEALRSRQNELIKEKAAQVYSTRKAALEREYRAKTGSYQGFLLGCLLYGLLTTVFTAVRSERFVADFKAFFVGLWSGVCWLARAVLQLGQAAAELGDKIQNLTAAVVVHWLLLVVVVGGIGAAVLGGLLWGVKKLLDFYKENYADTQSLVVFIISLAVVVFFAEPIREYIPLNLLLLLLMVHIAYMGVRWYLVNKCDQ